MNRYFLILFIALGLIVLLLVLVSGGGGKKSQMHPVVPLTSLANTNAQVQMSISGPIVAPQNHTGIVITGSQYSATYDQLQGFEGTVVSTSTTPNTENSYKAFLASLSRAGYTRGNTDPNLANEAGYCPTGNRYVFKLIQDGNTEQRFWITNCVSTPRTYLGNFPLTLNLFEAQIPNFNQLNRNSGVF